MSNNDNNNKNPDLPPNYPPQAHLDAGPYPPQPTPSPGPGALDYYNHSQYQPSPPNNYGPPVPFNNQGGYGPPQAYYGPPQPAPGMYYGSQQGYYQGGYQPQGYYADRGRGQPSAAEGICAGLLGALACCCCLDFLF